MKRTEYRIVKRASVDSPHATLRYQGYPHYYSVEKREHFTAKRWRLFGPTQECVTEWKQVDWHLSEETAKENVERLLAKGTDQVVWQGFESSKEPI